ncbi:AraC family ligand binding domain-containing protein [Blautia sp. RD014234]|nr:AraC family ligand binding domain-containing protein [Blautia parvula]
MREGKGYLEFDGRKYHLSKGQACLIDCYQPHAYGSDSGWEIEWIHFDGRCAGSYYDMIVKQSGNVFRLQEGRRRRCCGRSGICWSFWKVR